MFQPFLNWLDDRTNYRQLLAPIRRRVLPGGPSWGYSTAACVLWILVVQVVTGFLLMATYSPSTTSAWASVHYIEQFDSGSFLRGVHYYAGQAMIIAFAIHTTRVLLAAAFRAPHELIWITGLLLIPVVLIWAITGNPLAGSQKGMSQIEVEGNIIGSTPVIGPIIQRILIGGEEAGHLTLTHLYFLHVALLPLVVGVLLVIHLSQVYRHGLSAPRSQYDTASARPYWPYQTIRNMTVVSVVLGTIAVLAYVHGAPLEAPADPELSHSPRPEWYFLFLFELRGYPYFTGTYEFVATMVIPLVVLVLLLAMPLIDRAFSPRVSTAVRYLIVIAGLGAWAGLTLASVVRDNKDEAHRASLEKSAQYADRARVLADRRTIPPAGAIALLREDPKTQGPLLFQRHCASCHSHVNGQGEGIQAKEPSAPNLYRFASRAWIAGLLDPVKIVGPHYFGNTKFAEEEGDMIGSITDAFDEAEGDEDKKELRTQMKKVAWALSAEAGLAYQIDADQNDAPVIFEGIGLLQGDRGCTDCHRLHDQGELGDAPDLTGYGLRKWLVEMISNPQHERFYPDDKNDRMPAFAENPARPQSNLLSLSELFLLVHWLRGEWYEPEGK